MADNSSSTSISLDEVKEMKKECEQKIKEALAHFELSTGLLIEHISSSIYYDYKASGFESINEPERKPTRVYDVFVKVVL